MERVAGDIIVEIEYQGANVSCVLTEKGKVLVDVPYFPQDVSHWQQALEGAGRGEVAYVINTDHHFDHSIGNCHFGGLVVGQTRTYQEMSRPGGTLLESFLPVIEEQDEAAAEAIKGYPIVPPGITFNDSLTLHMGNKTVEILHMGGHTPATSSVYIPQLKVLLAGDAVVSDSFPYMGQADSGQWMQALETIKGMDIERIVPGHGEVCGMEAVDKLVEYFKELRQRVQQLVEAGKNREEVSQQVDLLGYFPVDDDSREMAVMCVVSGAELMYDEITASS